jgi:ABC-2 type transport system ATP-binding protein
MLDLPRHTTPGGGDRALDSDAQSVERGARSSVRTDKVTLAVNGVALPPGAPRSALRAPPHSEPVLLCERVSKWYGPVIGVNQVTLELRQGVTGLVGANGAGKSTLMRLITGQLRPDIGRVSVLGHDSWSAGAKRHVGYCPEIDSFYEEMSGRQFVQAMARLCGYAKAEARYRTEAALELVGMAGRADRRVRGYSKGMRQRIKMAQALLNDPALLVLDEPLSGIDPVGRWELITLYRKLADRGKCLLISSHELEELEKLTEHVAIMARGRIAAVGTVAEIRDRLDNHPLSVRLDVRRRAWGSDGDRQRELAAALLKLPDVAGVELLDDVAIDADSGRVLVRARNPQRFFADLARLVLDEWFEVQHLETIDDSAGAVLDYLLGAR